MGLKKGGGKLQHTQVGLLPHETTLDIFNQANETSSANKDPFAPKRINAEDLRSSVEAGMRSHADVKAFMKNW